MEALPIPLELAFAAKRRRHSRAMALTGEQIARAAFRRAVWARSRRAIAAVLVVTCSAIWAAKWHEVKVQSLEAENAELIALLRADRTPITVIATGCGREELLDHLSAASAQFDEFRWQLRRAGH